MLAHVQPPYLLPSLAPTLYGVVISLLEGLHQLPQQWPVMCFISGHAADTATQALADLLEPCSRDGIALCQPCQLLVQLGRVQGPDALCLLAPPVIGCVWSFRPSSPLRLPHLNVCCCCCCYRGVPCSLPYPGGRLAAADHFHGLVWTRHG